METLEQCNAAGAEAGASGLPFSDCPYTFARANVDQRTFEAEWRPRLNAWFAGWKRTAPPVKKKFNPRWHKAT